MVFSSHVFILVFLPATVLATLLARRLAGRTGVVVILIAASMIFYAWWDWRFLGLLWASIFFNYYWSRILLLPYPERRRRWLLGAGIAVNLSVLCFFKYTNFFLENLRLLTDHRFDTLYIILPLGISFITFQKIAYLVDVWRDRPRSYALLDYMLFVCFFPQLIAGPIVHHKELIPQLRRADLGRLELASLNRGIAVFVIGLAKKVLVADSLAVYADGVFAVARGGGPLSAFEAWAGTLAYALQLYFDFSGYADMAIGLGLIFGLRLPENFDRPYNAASISDFWRRWHISLSRFLRDYLYVPLGGNRHGGARELRNLMLTMVLGGIWHGAAWTFVLWGLLHGAYLVAHRTWRRLGGRLASPRGGRLLGWPLTFLAVVVAWVPFRAESLDATWVLWRAMLAGPALPDAARVVLGPGLSAWLASLGLDIAGPMHLGLRAWSTGLALLGLCLVLALVLPNGHRLADLALRPLLPEAGRARPLATLARGAAAAVLFVGALVYMSHNTVFLYYQF